MILDVVSPLHSHSPCVVDRTQARNKWAEEPEVVVSDQECGMKRIVNVVCAAAAMLWLAGPASATPVTFQGGEFDVTVSDLGGNVYRFIYTADFTGWDDSSNDKFITAIDFGLPGWNDIDSVTLVSDTAPGNWAVMQGNGSANNCSEKTNHFKICAQENPLLPSASTQDDQIYTWTIDVAYGSIGNLGALTSNDNPIKAVFYELDCKTNKKTGAVTCSPKQTGNMSLTTNYGTTTTTTSTSTSTSTSTPTTSTSTNTTDTPTGAVPEPTVMALLGAGLLLVGRRLRHRSS